jgi:glyoxylase-like metal-dependent hydrolase (beta-lactamase superfamily II)
MTVSPPQETIHEIIPVGWLQCNCHVVGDPSTREALVIDPGDDTERILDVVSRHGLTVKAIVITHAHIDHVGGLRKMREATGAPVYMHPDDFDLYAILDQQAAMIGMRNPGRVEVDAPLHEGDAVRWGGYEARVIHTPGHSRGSVSLYLPPHVGSLVSTGEGKLFAGDTLFAGSIGRTDLWGGSFDDILSSIHTKLLSLPEDTVVYPGHGFATTIGEERQSNPFLQPR